MRKITLGQCKINDVGKRYVNDALNNNRLSAGKYTQKFEEDFAKLHQCKYGVFCNSGTSALQISLAALKELYGYKDGDEVLVPATTFIATSNVVLQNNLTPVFVDVDPLTFNIDPLKIEAKITSRTRACIPVHLFGLPADMDSISVIAKTHSLNIIEDSCETCFAGIRGKSVGSFGDIACFSTYVAHLIVGGVGGVVTTDNPELEKLCRSLMAHGRDSIYTNIDQDDAADDALLKEMIERRYRFERVGYSYRATELEAAIALSELEQWEANIQTRRTNAAYLKRKLQDIDCLQLPMIPARYDHSFMMFPMVLDADRHRELFLLHLEKNGIETRYLFPLLEQPVYQKLFPDMAKDYPVAQHLSRHGFFIGMHQAMTLEDMDYISDVIHEYFVR